MILSTLVFLRNGAADHAGGHFTEVIARSSSQIRDQTAAASCISEAPSELLMTT